MTTEAEMEQQKREYGNGFLSSEDEDEESNEL